MTVFDTAGYEWSSTVLYNQACSCHNHIITRIASSHYSFIAWVLSSQYFIIPWTASSNCYTIPLVLISHYILIHDYIIYCISTHYLYLIITLTTKQ